MGRFDRSQSAQIGRQIEESVEAVRVAKVAQVFEHVQESDKSNFEVNAEILGTEKEHRAIPYMPPANDEISIPTVGDKVLVEYRGDNKKQAIARQAAFTDEDRAPLGRAGLWRKKIKSDDSPAGSGDLYVETFTEYSKDPATDDPSEDSVDAEKSFIRLAKKAADQDDVGGMKVEMLDDPNGDAAEVVVELTQDDGSASTKTWGMKFDLKTGEFKVLGPEGYGIVSDGAGNFTWHHETIDFSEGTTTSL